MSMVAQKILNQSIDTSKEVNQPKRLSNFMCYQRPECKESAPLDYMKAYRSTISILH